MNNDINMIWTYAMKYMVWTGDEHDNYEYIWFTSKS